ncbi:MAG: hypothetical protein Q8P25_02710 [Candidatus Curtissbacteria bacterium]|nr:hypothetical protein [Candidatus Curtissbacteria bacterium]
MERVTSLVRKILRRPSSQTETASETQIEPEKPVPHCFAPEGTYEKLMALVPADVMMADTIDKGSVVVGSGRKGWDFAVAKWPGSEELHVSVVIREGSSSYPYSLSGFFIDPNQAVWKQSKYFSDRSIGKMVEIGIDELISAIDKALIAEQKRQRRKSSMEK